MARWDFFIGPHIVPGIYQKISIPEAGVNWQISQGAGGGVGAATIWRGMKVPEGGISIETLLTDDDGLVVSDVSDAAAVWFPFLTLVHPNVKTKPPKFSCAHPLLIARQPPISDCAHYSNHIISPKGDHLSWHGILVLQAYYPFKRIAAAPPDPAIINDKTKGPADAFEAKLEALQKEAGF